MFILALMDFLLLSFFEAQGDICSLQENYQAALSACRFHTEEGVEWRGVGACLWNDIQEASPNINK